MIGLDIVYCATAGKSMQYLYHKTCPGWRSGTCAPFGLSAWIVVFAVIQMFLSTVSAMQAITAKSLPKAYLQCFSANLHDVPTPIQICLLTHVAGFA